MKNRYTVYFDVDVVAGTTAQGIVEFDGVPYEVIATPASNLERLRQLHEQEEPRKKVGMGGPMISLGPRGGCPCCGC